MLVGLLPAFRGYGAAHPALYGDCGRGRPTGQETGRAMRPTCSDIRSSYRSHLVVCLGVEDYPLIGLVNHPSAAVGTDQNIIGDADPA